MDLSSIGFLFDIYDNIDVFILIAVRFLAFFLLIPVLSGQYVTNQVKIGLAMFVAIVIMSSGNVYVASYQDSFIGYISLLTGEFIIGFIIAFVVYMVFSAFLFAGQLIDFHIGFSMVSVFDPVSQIQVPITGNMYYIVAVVMFVQLGGLSSFIHTVFYSYEAIPIGRAFLLDNGVLVSNIIKILTDFVIIGVKMSLPVMGTILLVDIALGLLTKAVPQMNVFVVGMPIKLFVGLLVLFITAPLISEFYNTAYNMAVNYTMTVIQGMMK